MIQMNSFPFFFYILTGLKTWILKPSKFLFLFLIKCYISVLKSRKKASKVINDYTHICVSFPFLISVERSVFRYSLEENCELDQCAEKLIIFYYLKS